MIIDELLTTTPQMTGTTFAVWLKTATRPIAAVITLQSVSEEKAGRDALNVLNYAPEYEHLRTSREEVSISTILCL